jgi:hypothetical protein
VFTLTRPSVFISLLQLTGRTGRKDAQPVSSQYSDIEMKKVGRRCLCVLSFFLVRCWMFFFPPLRNWSDEDACMICFSYSSELGRTSFSYTSDIGRQGPGRGVLTHRVSTIKMLNYPFTRPFLTRSKILLLCVFEKYKYKSVQILHTSLFPVNDRLPLLITNVNQPLFFPYVFPPCLLIF